MAQAKSGDTVRVHYTGRLEDGTVFDTSRERDPLEFTLGQHQVIPGFEQGVIGMETGEAKKIEIPSAQAYGPHDVRLVTEVSRDQIPPDLKLKVNDRLQVGRRDGGTAIVKVTAVSDSSVTLDANHPLAGEDLTFDVELVEIV